MLKRSKTCVAVIRGKRRKLIMAGDRMLSWGDQSQTSVDPKVFKRDGLLLGGSGLGYLCDIVCRVMPIPIRGAKENTFTYMHEAFFKQLKITLEDRGYILKNGEMPIECDAQIIVGISGDLYEVQLVPGLGITIDKIDVPYAIGCGGPFALGSLKTTESLGMTPKDRLELALRIAADTSTGCDDNIDIIEED